MTIRNFYADLYIKAGTDSFSLTTQELLDTELASNWTKIGAIEAGWEMKEDPGQKKEIQNGQMVVLSNIVTGKIAIIESTIANYQHLRSTFHRKVCNVIANESYGATGHAARAKNVYPVITKEGKSGDLIKINITFKTESATASLEEVDLT